VCKNPGKGKFEEIYSAKEGAKENLDRKKQQPLAKEIGKNPGT